MAVFSPSPIIQPPPHIQTAQAFINRLNSINTNQNRNNGYANTNLHGYNGYTNTNQYGLDYGNDYLNRNGNGFTTSNHYSHGYHGKGQVFTSLTNHPYRGSEYAGLNNNVFKNNQNYIDYYYDDTTDGGSNEAIYDRDDAIDDTNIDTAYLIAKTFPEIFILASYGLALTIIIYGSLSFMEPYVGCPASRGLVEESNNITKQAEVEMNDEGSFIERAFDMISGISEEESSRKQSSFMFLVDNYDGLLKEGKSSFSGSIQPIPLTADSRLFSIACASVSRPFLTAFLVVWIPIIVFCFVTGFFVTDVNLFRKKSEDIEEVNIDVENDYDYTDDPGERSWYSAFDNQFWY